MLRAFNAFQFNAVLVGSPFLINWLSEQESSWSGPAFYVGCIAFALQFIIATACVSDSLKELEDSGE